MVSKSELVEQENGENADESNNATDDIDLAKWLLAKGYAELTDRWTDYPVTNLLSTGKHEHEMIITDIDGQIIRARPCAFTQLYARMNEVCFFPHPV